MMHRDVLRVARGKQTSRFGMAALNQADRCAIRFGASRLERPQQLANPQLATFLQCCAEDSLVALPAIGRVSTRVREILARGLKDGELSLKPVAKTLGMSERRLRRQLGTEKTTLKRITEELQRELAMNYLKPHDLSVSAVAYLLGFPETAPFFAPSGGGRD